MNTNEQKKNDERRRSARNANIRNSLTSDNAGSPRTEATAPTSTPPTTAFTNESTSTKKGKKKATSSPSQDVEMPDAPPADEDDERDAALFEKNQLRGGFRDGSERRSNFSAPPTQGTIGPPRPRRSLGQPESSAPNPSSRPTYPGMMNPPPRPSTAALPPSYAAATASTNAKKKAVVKLPVENLEGKTPYDPSRPLRYEDYGDFMRYTVHGGEEDYQAAGGDARYKPENEKEDEVEKSDKGKKGKGKGRK